MQTKLNDDLENLAQWLFNHKLTLNVKKSKFMVIGSSKNQNSSREITLMIKGKQLDKVTVFKYLGVLINENLSWSDHVDYVISKVSKRLGMLQRIKHLLPVWTRNHLINALILPILDYGDIVWGDKSNITLMNNIQIMHNKVAKFVLNQPKFSLSSEALEKLNWRTLFARRKCRRLVFIYKCLNNLIDINSDFTFFKDVHSYNTRFKNNVCLPKVKHNWGKQRSVYHCVSEWNNLREDIRNIPNLHQFKKAVFNII